ncbi:MAG: hypothetical protein NT056_06075 [Proteobacteria bacterium]|nr:hypothetical protein [Pseudomonadota bacterium]
MSKNKKNRTSKILKNSTAVIGVFNRALVKIPLVGEKMVAGTSKSLGRLTARNRMLGFRTDPSYENALFNWELFLELIGAEFKKDDLSPTAKIYTFVRCPAGYTEPEHLGACVATMELDQSLVSTSGGQLIIEKRIPIDGLCAVRIVPA